MSERQQGTREPHAPTAREKLDELAATGMYVFHGSPDPHIEEFEPRQAHNYDASTDTNVPDGAPAVFASDRVDIPIFMALFNRTHSANSASVLSGTGVRSDGEVRKGEFRATKNLIDGVRKPGVYGIVYVFDRSQFLPREPGSSEWICNTVIHPTMALTVYISDFPEKVTEITVDGKPV